MVNSGQIIDLITGEPKILNVTQGVIGVDDGFNTKKANITSSKMNDTEILNATHSLAISSLNEKPNNMHGFYVVVLCVSIAVLLISAGTAGLLLARKLRRSQPRTSQVMTFFSTLVVVLGAYFLDRVTGRPPDNVRAVPNLEDGQAELMLENH